MVGCPPESKTTQTTRMTACCLGESGCHTRARAFHTLAADTVGAKGGGGNRKTSSSGIEKNGKTEVA